jgi:hypothetical protein
MCTFRCEADRYREWAMSTDWAGRPPSNDGRTADLRELAEALTALGNYLAASHGIVVGRGSCTQEILGEALQKATDQHERSAAAVRRLRRLF